MKHDIFENTMAEMTWYEVEEKAKQKALVLFPVGVIEEHGGHLPLGTDIYISYAQAKIIADRMTQCDYPCIIAPPYYFGINSVLTKNFPGSFSVSKETLGMVIRDILENLEKFGFQNVVLLNAHGDPTHRKVITDALEEFNRLHSLQGKWLTFPCDLQQEGFEGNENYLTVLPDEILYQLGSIDGELGDPFDVHAGAFETATMSELFPDLVHSDVALSAKPTCLANEQIDQWLSGEEQYTDIISSGYVGDPASYQKVHPTPQQYYGAIADHLMKTFPKALS